MNVCICIQISLHPAGTTEELFHREEGGKLSLWGDFSAAHGFLKKTQYIVQALELTARKFPLPPEDSVEPTSKNPLSPPHVPSCLLFCLKPGTRAVSKLESGGFKPAGAPSTKPLNLVGSWFSVLCFLPSTPATHTPFQLPPPPLWETVLPASVLGLPVRRVCPRSGLHNCASP